MALEGILSSVGEAILNQLGSQASECLGMVCGLNDGLNKLRSNVSSIQVVLGEAEERQMKGDDDHSLKVWLGKLGEVYYDVDDVLDEISAEALHREVMTRGKNAKQVRIFFSNSNQLAFNYRMSCELKNINERLHDISKEKDKFHLNPNVEPNIPHASSHPTGMEAETHTSLSGEKVIGRDDDMRNLKKLLLAEDEKVKANVSFIAIVGMGGIGKTTLAKALYNDKDISDCFSPRIWISLSDDEFHRRIIFEKIIESATGNKCNIYEINALKRRLRKVIEGKKYLLVMDDVWNESEEEWDNLKNLLMVGARGSKVLITKHDSEVVEEVETVLLKNLSDEYSWLLFKEVAFEESELESTNPNLLQLGKEISKKCDGIPIVIRHIGRLLYKNTSEEDWESIKNDKLLNVTREENNAHVISKLKLSYNNLPPNLKQCFAYTSLFPKKYKISRKELIRQWVAQGFIESSNGEKSMEDIGKDYLKELYSRWFYESSSDHEFGLKGDIVCMHDVMRDLAREVGGNKFVYGDPKNEYIVSEQTRHISFAYKIQSLDYVLSKLCKAKGLRTFILLCLDHKKNPIDGTVLDKLFSKFPRLRVLGLTNSRIRKVSVSIKKLRHLRYLDLSRNSRMESLPNSITELQNLQTLYLTPDVEDLKELPRDISKLVNLRHLLFYFYQNTFHMPEGLKKLSYLQTLSLFVFDCKKFNKLREEFNELNCFIGELRIIGLEQLRRTPSEANSLNLKGRRGYRSLLLEWKLGNVEEYEGDGRDETILEGLEPHPDVQILRIMGYCGVGLPNWVSSSSSLNYLISISIINCHRLQHLNQLSHLQGLKDLRLRGLRSLMSLSEWIGSMTSLEELRIGKCPELKSLPKEMRQLKSLEQLYIEDCPELEERCKEGGEDWPNISHVTLIDVFKMPGSLL